LSQHDGALTEKGQREIDESRRIGGLQIVAIHPRKLVLVEHTGAVGDGRQLEAACELIERQHLFALSRRPSNEREIVRQCFRQITLRSKFRDGRRAMPFRQRRVIGAHDEREVRKGRRRPAERLVQQHLSRGIGDVILAADHVRDLHQRIVDHDGKVVGRYAIGPQQHGIADDLRMKSHFAADDVVEHHVAIRRHTKSDGGRFAGREPLSRGDERDCATPS
jgi:hypothetical protein